MEYAIAIFVGIWITVAGILAYNRISKDFSDLNNSEKKENNGGDQQ